MLHLEYDNSQLCYMDSQCYHMQMIQTRFNYFFCFEITQSEVQHFVSIWLSVVIHFPVVLTNHILRDFKQNGVGQCSCNVIMIYLQLQQKGNQGAESTFCNDLTKKYLLNFSTVFLFLVTTVTVTLSTTVPGMHLQILLYTWSYLLVF